MVCTEELVETVHRGQARVLIAGVVPAELTSLVARRLEPANEEMRRLPGTPFRSFDARTRSTSSRVGAVGCVDS
jgi:hypothetical protein